MDIGHVLLVDLLLETTIRCKLCSTVDAILGGQRAELLSHIFLGRSHVFNMRFGMEVLRLDGLVMGARELSALGKLLLESVEVLRVDFFLTDHELLKLVGHLLFDPDLLQVVYVHADWVFAEKVAHEDVLDVTLFVEARLLLGGRFFAAHGDEAAVRFAET